MEVPSELKGAFVRRPADAHKYSVGTVTVTGGSEQYSHAPVIAGLGARAAGAGLVRLVVPSVSRFAAGALLPEATFAELDAAGVPPRADVQVVGMGLGISAEAGKIVSRFASGSDGRLVLDADALAILSSGCVRFGEGGADARRELVLTPHEGEAAKLLGWTRERVSDNRLEAAKAIAGRYGATVVLKGRKTLVVSSDGARVYVNGSGNPFMALGGMGDLLSGIIGARWAYLKGDPFLAAASAVWLHGAASDSVVAAARDPSVINTAHAVGSLRVMLDA